MNVPPPAHKPVGRRPVGATAPPPAGFNTQPTSPFGPAVHSPDALAHLHAQMAQYGVNIAQANAMSQQQLAAAVSQYTVPMPTASSAPMQQLAAAMQQYGVAAPDPAAALSAAAMATLAASQSFAPEALAAQMAATHLQSSYPARANMASAQIPSPFAQPAAAAPTYATHQAQPAVNPTRPAAFDQTSNVPRPGPQPMHPPHSGQPPVRGNAPPIPTSSRPDFSRMTSQSSLNSPNAGPYQPQAASGLQSPDNGHSRRTSMTSSVGINTPSTTFSTPESVSQPTAVPDPNAKICMSCKSSIPQNVSIFNCLICSTAQITTHICVWCYTTGAASNSHQHDVSYLATESDIRIQGPNGNIPPDQWTIRKNASGRLWYTHHQSGLKTHVRPLTATGEDTEASARLPQGWQEVRTQDGKFYYYQAATGTSTWTRPKKSLPSDWRVVSTPDGVPFYVHDNLQLATWDRPGEQPKGRPDARPRQTAPPPSQPAPSNPSRNPTTSRAPAAPGPAPTPSTVAVQPYRVSTATSKAVTSASIANNMSKLSAASDMTASGIMTATAAAARLTGLGVKVAGRKIGKLGKNKRLSTMATTAGVLGTAAVVTNVMAGDGTGDNQWLQDLGSTLVDGLANYSTEDTAQQDDNVPPLAEMNSTQQLAWFAEQGAIAEQQQQQQQDATVVSFLADMNSAQQLAGLAEEGGLMAQEEQANNVPPLADMNAAQQQAWFAEQSGLTQQQQPSDVMYATQFQTEGAYPSEYQQAVPEFQPSPYSAQPDYAYATEQAPQPQQFPPQEQQQPATINGFNITADQDAGYNPNAQNIDYAAPDTYGQGSYFDPSQYNQAVQQEIPASFPPAAESIATPGYTYTATEPIQYGQPDQAATPSSEQSLAGHIPSEDPNPASIPPAPEPAYEQPSGSQIQQGIPPQIESAVETQLTPMGDSSQPPSSFAAPSQEHQTPLPGPPIETSQSETNGFAATDSTQPDQQGNSPSNLQGSASDAAAAASSAILQSISAGPPEVIIPPKDISDLI